MVAVTVAGDPADTGALESALAELMGRLDATLSLRRASAPGQAAGSPPPRADAWVGIDVTHPDRAVLTVVDPSTGEATVWRVLERRASRQVLLDEIAHVVHTAVESLLAARTATAVEPPTTAPPGAAADRPADRPAPVATSSSAPTASPGREPLRTADQPSPPPPEEWPWGLDAAALVAGHGMADDAGLVFGATGALAAGYREGPWRLGGWLTAEYRVPFDIDGAKAPPHAQTVALRTFPTVGLLQTPAVALDLGIGGGVDIFNVDYRIADQRGRGSHRRSTEVAAIFTTTAVVYLAVVDNVQLTALAGIDVDPTRPNLEIREDRSEDARPWVVRPSLQLGASFTVLGTEPVE